MIIRTLNYEDPYKLPELNLTRSKSQNNASDFLVQKSFFRKQKSSIFKKQSQSHLQTTNEHSNNLNIQKVSPQNEKKTKFEKNGRLSLYQNKQKQNNNYLQQKKGRRLSFINQSVFLSLKNREHNKQDKKCDLKTQLFKKHEISLQKRKDSQVMTPYQALKRKKHLIFSQKKKLTLNHQKLINFKKTESFQQTGKENFNQNQIVKQTTINQFTQIHHNNLSCQKLLPLSSQKQIHSILQISSVLCITVYSTEPSQNKVNVQIQTQQNDEQFFHYLKFKRKKYALQEQFVKVFSQLQLIKRERSLYSQRLQNLIFLKEKGPENQRQQRIFELKQQINAMKTQLKNCIQQKTKTFACYLNQISVSGKTFIQNCQQYIKISGKYFNSINNVLKDFQQCQINRQKQTKQLTKIRIVKRLSKIAKNKIFKISDTLIKFSKNLEKILEMGMKFKQQMIDISSKYAYFIRALNEQKTLFKNCYHHIKSIPELCYELYGHQIFVYPEFSKDCKQNEIQNENKNQISVKVQFPKCMNCYNSKWKSHMMIEKNILMQSILKVFQQILA